MKFSNQNEDLRTRITRIERIHTDFFYQRLSAKSA